MDEKYDLYDTTLNVISEDGKPIIIDVIDIFSFTGDDTEYIIYSIGTDVYASILDDETETFELLPIENKEDYARILERIEELTS